MTVDFRNESTNKFVDNSSEEFRRYDFSGDAFVLIKEPLHLSVSAGGHRILDAQGICHYIPKGWIHLWWKVKEGQPHFVK